MNINKETLRVKYNGAITPSDETWFCRECKCAFLDHIADYDGPYRCEEHPLTSCWWPGKTKDFSGWLEQVDEFDMLVRRARKKVPLK